MDTYLTSSKNLTISVYRSGAHQKPDGTVALGLVKVPFTMGHGIGKSKDLLPSMSPLGQGKEEPPEAGRGHAIWKRLSGGSVPIRSVGQTEGIRHTLGIIVVFSVYGV